MRVYVFEVQAPGHDVTTVKVTAYTEGKAWSILGQILTPGVHIVSVREEVKPNEEAEAEAPQDREAQGSPSRQ